MLKILILDDSVSKIKKIENVLKKYSEIEMRSLQICLNMRDAKIELRKNKYDLFILDIQVPNRLGETPQINGGVDLLKEIHTRDVYNKPNCIIGLTEYADLRDEFNNEFTDRLWNLIYYEASSLDWADRLRSKIEYLLEMKKANQTSIIYENDLCIITALNEPEFTELLSIGDWEKENIDLDATHYVRTQFSTDNKKLNVIAAHAPQMGMAATAVLTTKMINHFKPKYMAMIGITAGEPKNIELGDLVVADPCWDWGSGKQRRTTNGQQFDPDPLQERLNPALKALFEDVKRDTSILITSWDECLKKKPKNVPKLHIGPCASGASVLADGKIRDEISAKNRKLIGIDMEAFGLMHAVTHSIVPSPKGFSLKGVCDFADETKCDDIHEYTAWMSATVLKKIALKYF